MSNFSSDSSTKYVNPTSVPNSLSQTILSTDPRNNTLYLLQNPLTVVIEQEELPLNEENYPSEDSYAYMSESVEPAFAENYESPEDLTFTGKAILSSPSNLLINSNTFQIESNSSVNGDGTVTYAATLTFDDVAGASGYEYIINADV
jgi:hypothetical protein